MNNLAILLVASFALASCTFTQTAEHKYAQSENIRWSYSPVVCQDGSLSTRCPLR
jgi:hypothetical protein